jgi:hypothetical protein
MQDSDASVNVLANSFTAMAESIRSISKIAETLPTDGSTGEAREALLGISGQVADRVRQAIIAFQFYDKLAQRLGHVGGGLAELGNLIGDQERLFNPREWAALQQRIKAKYSTHEEIAMFEAVMQGQPVHEAVSQFLAARKDRADDIELF